MTATLQRVREVTGRTAKRPAWSSGGGASRYGLALTVITGLLVGLRQAEHPYGDGDALWGIRAGMDFLRTGQVPRHDPYSWTAHGAQWVPNSWAWNVVLGSAYRIGGLVGVALLVAAMTALLSTLIGVAARRAGADGVLPAMLFQIVGGFFAAVVSARPQVVDYSAVLALLILLPDALSVQRRRALRAGAGIVVLQVVWMNLHSSAMLGPVLIIAAGAGSVLMSPGRRRTVARRVACLAVLSGLACCATPYGTTLIAHAREVRSASVGVVDEWAPVAFVDGVQWPAVVVLAAGAIAVWLAWRVRRFDTIAVLLVLGVATASAVRFAPLLVFAVLPTFAAAGRSLPIRPAMLVRAWAAATAFLALTCVLGTSSFADPGPEYDSTTLLRQLPAGCRLFNDYDIGGAVILRRPDVAVSFDSRNDLYGRARELQLLRAMHEPSVGVAYLARHDVTCVLAPSDLPLVRRLADDASWRVVARDSVRTLLVPRT